MEKETKIKSIALSKGEGQHKVVCPFCIDQRKKKNEKTLSINNKDLTIVYQCWHCNVSGSIKNKKSSNELNQKSSNELFKPKNIEGIKMVEKTYSKLNEASLEYLSARGISEITANKIGVGFTRRFIGSVQKETNCIVFPYKNKGITYATKYRSFPEKGFSCDGSAQTMFNIENVDTDQDLILCEGELDVLSFIESSFDNVVSVPNGAIMKVVDGKIDPNEDNKFQFIWNSKEKLDLINKIIIATDNDISGVAMAEEIARRVGKDKCWKVEYPKECKDANDVLKKFGTEGIKNIIKGAIPFPVRGLYSASQFYDELDEIYEKGIGSGESTGYACVDDLYSIVSGQLSVVTGHPSSGKSEFIDQIMVNLAMTKGWKFGVCSFENEPRVHIAKLISKYLRKPFFEGITPRMSKVELRSGKDFIQKHFSFLYQADGSLSSLDSILERMKVAVMRQGIRGIVIDPYNYIARPNDVSETHYISELLTRLRVFAQAHDIHIWFVCHPTKMVRDNNGKIPPPKGYDISGSANFFSKADLGLTVHREDPINSLMSQIIIWKCRFMWVGRIGQTNLRYDKITSCYYDDDGVDPMLSKLPSTQIDFIDNEDDIPF
tara:strand:- start:2220 stop:4034 length:1815 start_codon:yes stop_codon:yes gene_type:complete